MSVCIFPYYPSSSLSALNRQTFPVSNLPPLFSQSVHKGPCTSSCPSKNSGHSSLRLSRLLSPEGLLYLAAICKCPQNHSCASGFQLGNQLAKILPPTLFCLEYLGLILDTIQPKSSFQKTNFFPSELTLRTEMPL